MKKKLILSALVAAMSFGLVLGGASTVLAKASGLCSDCHTMHDSQGGSDDLGDAGLQSKLLLKGTCLGCHTGDNTAGGNIPYVMGTANPNYGGATTDEGTGTEGTATTLAGGNFYWVENGTSTGAYTGLDADVFGHNVSSLTNSTDTALSGTPPGFNTNNSANGAVATTWAVDQLTCAGTNGCHGLHTTTDEFQAVSGGHHGDDSSLDGTTVAKSYRFLKGIIGAEDAAWEFTPLAGEHNQYHGAARTAVANPPTATNTISYLCAECHGDFHNGTGNIHSTTTVGSPWLRHPTDFDLAQTAAGSEYRDYGGNGTNAYQVIAPVASTLTSPVDNTSTTLDLATISFTGSDAVVTCVSCHRAHGTPYADILRWDPTTAEAGTAGDTGGCLICHTSK